MPTGRQVVVSAILVSAVLLVGFALVDQIASTTETTNPSLSEDVTRDDVLLGAAGEKVTVANGAGTDETVYKTTGYAVNLSGADDSYVQSDADVDVATDANWTVSVWAQPDPGTETRNMTALSVNGRVVVFWNGTAGNWSAWYYDDGSRNSFQVNVSDDGAAVGNLTNVQVRANASELRIYRNGTLGEVEDLTVADASSIVDAPVTASTWDGRLEEVRTFDRALDAANRSALVDSPVEQQPGLDPTARMMFDQPDRSTQLILYSSSDLTQSNVTFSAGFPEQVMDGQNIGNDLLGATDYIWYPQEPALEPTAGGELDGAPVAYVSYTFDDSFESIKDQVVAALVLGGLLPLVVIGAFLLRRLRDL